MLSTIYLPWYYGIYRVYYAGTQLAWYARRGNPPENFTFLRKKHEIVNILCFLLSYNRCLMDLGSETYLEFEIW